MTKSRSQKFYLSLKKYILLILIPEFFGASLNFVPEVKALLAIPTPHILYLILFTFNWK